MLGEAAPEEPRFSTWEDVKAKRKASGQSAQVQLEDLLGLLCCCWLRVAALPANSGQAWLRC